MLGCTLFYDSVVSRRVLRHTKPTRHKTVHCRALGRQNGAFCKSMAWAAPLLESFVGVFSNVVSHVHERKIGQGCQNESDRLTWSQCSQSHKGETELWMGVSSTYTRRRQDHLSLRSMSVAAFPRSCERHPHVRRMLFVAVMGSLVTFLSTHAGTRHVIGTMPPRYGVSRQCPDSLPQRVPCGMPAEVN